MKAEFWQQSWQQGRIGFHQAKVNSRLKRHWSELKLAQDTTVLVPLCGKSIDMLWLHARQHTVLGIELSVKAVRAFFTENNLPYAEQQMGEFTELAGVDQAQGLRVLAGDFFALTKAHCANVRAFYDRASLVAFPENMRADYVRHLASVLPASCDGLLISMNYDETQMKGPPFSVPDLQVQELLSGEFDIEQLARSSGPEYVGNLAERGLTTLEERVYHLRLRNAATSNTTRN